MTPTCPTCGQWLPAPRVQCACGHPQTSHSLPNNGPRGCGSAITQPGKRPQNCGCRLHQSEVVA